MRRTLGAAWLFFMIFVTFLACEPSGKKTESHPYFTTVACRTDLDCTNGMACRDSKCAPVAECENNMDCEGVDMICENAKCVEKKECNKNEDCNDENDCTADSCDDGKCAFIKAENAACSSNFKNITINLTTGSCHEFPYKPGDAGSEGLFALRFCDQLECESEICPPIYFIGTDDSIRYDNTKKTCKNRARESLSPCLYTSLQEGTEGTVTFEPSESWPCETLSSLNHFRLWMVHNPASAGNPARDWLYGWFPSKVKITTTLKNGETRSLYDNLPNQCNDKTKWLNKEGIENSLRLIP